MGTWRANNAETGNVRLVVAPGVDHPEGPTIVVPEAVDPWYDQPALSDDAPVDPLDAA